MAVAGHQAIAVVDLDHLAITAARSSDRNGARACGANWIAGIAAEVDPGMHRCFVNKRIHANAEGRTLVDVAGDWLRNGTFNSVVLKALASARARLTRESARPKAPSSEANFMGTNGPPLAAAAGRALSPSWANALRIARALFSWRSCIWLTDSACRCSTRSSAASRRPSAVPMLDC